MYDFPPSELRLSVDALKSELKRHERLVEAIRCAILAIEDYHGYKLSDDEYYDQKREDL